MKKIAVLLLNDYEHDSRVKKEVVSLSKGYKVDVYALSSGSHGVAQKTIKNVVVYKHVRYIRPNSRYRKKIMQLFTYVKFFFSGLLNLKNYDFIHCNDLEVLPIGVIAKIFYRNLSVVYDAHEYEIETLWMHNKFKKTIAEQIESFCIKYVDKVITVSDAIADEYVKLYGIEKPALVLNTPPYKEIEKKNIFRETLGIKEDKIIFLYQGGLSKGRGIEILLEVFKSLDNAVIVFMGYGPLESLIQVASKEYENIYFHQAVSPDVLLDYTCSADFGISTIEDICLSYRYCLPNKMFEYLMAEIPVIVSNLYEMKRLVESNKIGTVAKENTLDGLKDAIKEAVKLDKEELRLNIQKIKMLYNWKEQEKVLLNIYNEIGK